MTASHASTPASPSPVGVFETGHEQALHAQRVRGEVALSVGPHCIRRLREAGSLNIRLPSGSAQAILINTAGGIAGGDAYEVAVSAEPESRLCVTSQAAERVYRTLGPAATVTVRQRVDGAATLLWLPQETILFNRSGLHRSLEVDVDQRATFLGLETTILGRRESGEVIDSVDFRESWTIRRAGELIHSERFRLRGALPRAAAALRQAGAFATLVLVSPDAEARLQTCMQLVGQGGISAWNRKLVIRLAEQDGFHMRKRLLSLLPALATPADLPKVWLP